MKDSFFDDFTVAEMFDHDSFEQLRRYLGIPDTLWINDHNRTPGAHAEAGCFAPLHTRWSEKKAFALE
jgi:hypothetical protein